MQILAITFETHRPRYIRVRVALSAIGFIANKINLTMV